MRHNVLRLAQPTPSPGHLTITSCKDEEVTAPSGSLLYDAQARNENPASFEETCHRLSAHPASAFPAAALLSLQAPLFLAFAFRFFDLFRVVNFCALRFFVLAQQLSSFT
ncbi:unnamed protein product, partial [Laminaria digitata]